MAGRGGKCESLRAERVAEIPNQLLTRSLVFYRFLVPSGGEEDRKGKLR